MKMLFTSIFTFSYNVFNPVQNTFHLLRQCCQLKSKIFLCENGVNLKPPGKRCIKRDVQGKSNPFPNKSRFLCVCSTSLLKTLREKKKLLVTSNFSFSHSVFNPFGELNAIFIKFEIVFCKLFQFGRV